MSILITTAGSFFFVVFLRTINRQGRMWVINKTTHKTVSSGKTKLLSLAAGFEFPEPQSTFLPSRIQWPNHNGGAKNQCLIAVACLVCKSCCNKSSLYDRAGIWISRSGNSGKTEDHCEMQIIDRKHRPAFSTTQRTLVSRSTHALRRSRAKGTSPPNGLLRRPGSTSPPLRPLN